MPCHLPRKPLIISSFLFGVAATPVEWECFILSITSLPTQDHFIELCLYHCYGSIQRIVIVVVGSVAVQGMC